MGRLWALVWCVAACVHAGSGANGGPFAITYPDAPPTGVRAKVGKRFYAKPAAQCFYDNGREATWRMTGARVASGELPPGLTLEDGVIGGVPNHAGRYEAVITFSDVSCAGKPAPEQTVTVSITVK